VAEFTLSFIATATRAAEDTMDNREHPGEPPVLRMGPRLGDAFGQMLLTCLEGGVAPHATFELIERDDGYLDAMDATVYFAGPDTWGALDHWVCDQARGRVLDIGSGAGRHTLRLQERGLEVVALDVSPLAGEVCRRRGVRQIFTGTTADLARSDTGKASFDTFLLMGNNLGLLGGADQAHRFLQSLAAMARPDAIILGQGVDPYQVKNDLHLAYHARNRALGRMGGQIRLRVRHRDLAGEWFDYLFAAVDELRSLLEGTAWRLEHHETQPDSPHYVARIRYTG
jgi:SAM-dependent methyltransferase